MKNRFLHLVIILLLCLTTGVFWGTWLSIARSMDAFSAAEFIHIGQVIIQNVAWPMRIMMCAALILLTYGLWTHPDKRSRGFYLRLKVLLLYLGAFILTVAVLVPMDNDIRTWTVSTVPPNWEAIRDRWKLFHTIRTFLSLASFGSFAHLLLYAKQQENGGTCRRSI